MSPKIAPYIMTSSFFVCLAPVYHIPAPCGRPQCDKKPPAFQQAALVCDLYAVGSLTTPVNKGRPSGLTMANRKGRSRTKSISSGFSAAAVSPTVRIV